MIDFIKIKITDEILINKIWQNPLLEYDSKSEKRYNDEVKELIRRKYKNMYFTKYYNRLEISGSLHKFYNNQEHNANDFSHILVKSTIDQLKKTFLLELEKCNIINLEYGVNIISPIAVNDLVVNLIYHEKRQFIRATEHLHYKIAGNEAYKQIKAYNKYIHYPNFCKENTFRFEVKSKQSKYINKLKIYTLNDLYSTKTLQILGISLVNEWKNVLLFEQNSNVNSKYLNTNFWERKITLESRNQFNYHKKNYFKQLDKNNVHKQVENLIKQKVIQLI
jgi:hypothetical protein